MKISMRFYLPAFVLVLGLISNVVNAQENKRLAFGATNTQSSHYACFAALAQIVNDSVPGYQAQVVETGATVDNLKRTVRGQLDFGLGACPRIS